jgi:hypothetical protein
MPEKIAVIAKSAPSLASLTATFLSTILVFKLFSVAPALSWFDKGHRIVGFIAEAHLTAEARKEIDKILFGGMTLAEASVWPDHEGRSIRDFDPLHYVNIPDHADSYDQARDCAERNCMVEALVWFSEVLADRRVPVVMRRLALRFVAHLVGDMHQPLHAGRSRDRGGVDIQVIYRDQKTNLHYFWDRNLVDLEPGTEIEIADRLIASFAETERRRWQSGDPVQWTNESLMLARSHAYPVGPSGEISEDYVEKARPIVRTRLAQAGLRLAWLLNRVLGPAS